MSLKAVAQLLQVLDRVRKEAPELPTQQLHVLLAVAKYEGMSMSDIQDRCFMKNASGGRNIHALEVDTGDAREGKGWISVVINPKDKRERLLYLTDQGRAIIELITQPLTKES